MTYFCVIKFRTENFVFITIQYFERKLSKGVEEMGDLLRSKKVMTIGTVVEITGLSERQIRYYEQKELIFPERTSTGNRKFSFLDVEKLIEIAEKVEEGVRIKEIKEDFERSEKNKHYRRDILKSQINSR